MKFLMRQVFTVNTVGICRTMTNNRKSASPPEQIPVVRRFSASMGLCLYFLTVFEGDADIVCTVDGGVIHQRMPVFSAKLGECVRQFRKGLEEASMSARWQLHLLDPVTS